MKKEKWKTKYKIKVWAEADLYRSPAWHSLRGAAPQIFTIFLTKRRMKLEDDEWVITNNGEITFTYKEALEKYGIIGSTFQRGLSRLVEKGFIDITRYGSSYAPAGEKESLYAISERWKKYGTKKFVVKHMKKDRHNPGVPVLKSLAKRKKTKKG